MWSLCRKKGKFLHPWMNWYSFNFVEGISIGCCPFALPCNYNKAKTWKTFFDSINIITLCNIWRMQPESCSHVRNSCKNFFFLAAQPPVGQGLVVIEESRSHSDTPLSVELLWTTYQPDITKLNTQHSKETHVHVLDGIRTRLPSNRAAADPRLRQRDHRYQPHVRACIKIFPWKMSVNFIIFLVIHQAIYYSSELELR